ncbi:MAG: DUF6891 domain-containing protein [Anaerolineae bacterium]
METINELRTTIALQVRAGYDTREQIINQAFANLLGEYDPIWLEEQIISITDIALRRHYRTQRNWHHITDCDRLDEAFAELDRNGIVARQHFTSCQTRGHAEINQALSEASQHREVQGYVFFHQQDTEVALQNGYLYLAYGSVTGKEQESLAVAYQACGALMRAGLSISWNEHVHSRICVHDLKWQYRRLPQYLVHSS